VIGTPETRTITNEGLLALECDFLVPAALGPRSRGEKVVATVFACVAPGWILRPRIAAWAGLPGLDDAVIAIAGAIALFVIPVEPRERVFAMDWETARRLPWDILILFGGGLSLAAAIAANGVDSWLSRSFGGLAGAPELLTAGAVSALVVFLPEVTSNTAVTTTLLPVIAATADAIDMPAGLLLTVTAISASCAFMLPVATPPNAIVFASGQVTVGQMVRAGFGLNLVAVVLVPLLVLYGGCRLHGIGG